MSDSAFRDSIAALLGTVPGIGIVHKYERWSNEMSKFLSFFQDKVSKKIFGWEISRTGIENVEKIGYNKYKVTWTYKYKGYYGLQDAASSEISFSAIVDAIIFTFVSNQVAGSEMKTVPKRGLFEPRLFGTVLCHYAELDMGIPEIVTAVSSEEITSLTSIGLNYYLQPDQLNDGTSDAEDNISLPGG